MAKLGVNIDHIATLREARGGSEPSPVEAARIVEKAGADGITVHLREDRRHIHDRDVFILKKEIRTRLNLEMSLNEEIVGVALKVRPYSVCLVPERRRELTTEGGLDVSSEQSGIKKVIERLHAKGIIVSLFIDPSSGQIRASEQCGADYVELHTGKYANAKTERARGAELERLRGAGKLAIENGLRLNAGHGLDYANVVPVARIPHMEDLNIGHSIISRAVMVGLRDAVLEMKELIEK